MVFVAPAPQVAEGVGQGRIPEARKRSTLLPVPVAVFDGASLEIFRRAADCAGRQQVVLPTSPPLTRAVGW